MKLHVDSALTEMVSLSSSIDIMISISKSFRLVPSGIMAPDGFITVNNLDG